MGGVTTKLGGTKNWGHFPECPIGPGVGWRERLGDIVSNRVLEAINVTCHNSSHVSSSLRLVDKTFRRVDEHFEEYDKTGVINIKRN